MAHQCDEVFIGEGQDGLDPGHDVHASGVGHLPLRAEEEEEEEGGC